MHGSCLCGLVEFEAIPDRHVIACHCSQCRKQSGHFWAATFAWHKDFRLIRAEGLRWYDASDKARRGFCGGCGAFLFWQPVGEDRISIAGGAFDGETGLHIGENWHNEDAGDYYSPDGSAPPAPGAEPVVPLLQGSCLCGANRFALPGPMGAVTACHCHACRKTSGHYAASFPVTPEAITWHARQVDEHTDTKGNRRGFCLTCGSKLYVQDAAGGFQMPAAAVNIPTGGHLARHVFVAEKGDYHDLTDDLPQHPAGAGG